MFLVSMLVLSSILLPWRTVSCSQPLAHNSSSNVTRRVSLHPMHSPYRPDSPGPSCLSQYSSIHRRSRRASRKSAMISASERTFSLKLRAYGEQDGQQEPERGPNYLAMAWILVFEAGQLHVPGRCATRPTCSALNTDDRDWQEPAVGHLDFRSSGGVE